MHPNFKSSFSSSSPKLSDKLNARDTLLSKSRDGLLNEKVFFEGEDIVENPFFALYGHFPVANITVCKMTRIAEMDCLPVCEQAAAPCVSHVVDEKSADADKKLSIATFKFEPGTADL